MLTQNDNKSWHSQYFIAVLLEGLAFMHIIYMVYLTGSQFDFACCPLALLDHIEAPLYTGIIKYFNHMAGHEALN